MFIIFFKIGAFTIGGGYALIAVMRREFCDKYQWISEDEMVDALAISQSLPGLISGNASAFIGYKLRGVAGAVIALLGTVLPAFLSIILIAAFFPKIQDNKYVVKAFNGVRAGVTALILSNAVTMTVKLKDRVFSVSLVLLSFAASYFLNVNVFIVLILSGLCGVIYSKVRNVKNAVND